MVSGLKVLHTGVEFFPSLLADIALAKVEICIETYVFSNDQIGRRVMESLLEAVQRGVRVKLLADWVGTKGYMGIGFLSSFSRQLDVAFYNPGWFGPRGISRNHRKIIIIDERIAYVGGINILDDTYARGVKLDAPRWDFMLRVEETLVSVIYESFNLHWRIAKNPYAIGRESFKFRSKVKKKIGDGEIWFISRDNIRNRFAIEREYLRAIKLAKNSVCIASPYFVPGRRMRKSLLDAVNRGVRIRVLLGKKEFFLLDRVTRHLYDRFLSVGIELAEYESTWLHAKVGIVDGKWLTVGSSNFDALSFFLNHEANLVVRHHEIVNLMQNYFDDAFEGNAATRVFLYEVGERSVLNRMLDAACYFLYRMLMKILTIGRYD